MSTEVCPTCDGFCCRADSGMTVTHRNTRYAKHVCPDCDAGLVWTAYTEPAPVPAWTAEQERAAVVAFVRGARLDELADAIERGEHRREEEP